VLVSEETKPPVVAATYHLQLRLRLLQQWRMLQALAESDFSFSVPTAQRENVAYLRKFFGVRLSFADGRDIAGHLLQLDTIEPWCALAGLRRTLIYPHQVLRHCRARWKADRRIRFGFAGFAHHSRHEVLDAWHRRCFGRPLVPTTVRSSDEIAGYLEHELSTTVSVVYSKAGRSFPGKVWDDAYYDYLLNCTMTLCPDGEEVWTYRFFEAMLCGSIPVVQSDCAVYQGFRYGFLDDDPARIDCSADTVAHNIRLCRERLTIPLPELNDAIAYHLR